MNAAVRLSQRRIIRLARRRAERRAARLSLVNFDAIALRRAYLRTNPRSQRRAVNRAISNAVARATRALADTE